jgi:hypothetical protein
MLTRYSRSTDECPETWAFMYLWCASPFSSLTRIRE